MIAYNELLRALAPEAALVVGALAVLGVDLFAARSGDLMRRMRVSVALGLLSLIAAAFAAVSAGQAGPTFGGVLVLDSLTLATRLGVFLLAALSVGIATSIREQPHPAEYIAIQLFATAGFSTMAAANQLMLAFLALELASLSLYVLVGFDKTQRASAEAALKYFLFGGISAAFLLFGFSLLYGLTGSIELPVIATQLRIMEPNTMLVVALVMVVGGFGFKVAAAPFHLWAPDVYQGAPPASAALVASAAKLAGFGLFLRLLWGGLGPVAGTVRGEAGTPGWVAVIVILAALSLLIGNFAALAQSNVRRLLAYSAIAHAGALLIGVIAAGQFGPAAVYYYAATYGLATVGAFGVIAVVERTGRCQELGDLAGLYRRSPLLAGCLLVFVLSLAGIPPLAGFFGKFIVFATALRLNGVASPAGMLTLLAIALSAVALYYYLLILKQALVARPAPGAATIELPLAPAAALALAATLIIALGVFPSVLLRLLP